MTNESKTSEATDAVRVHLDKVPDLVKAWALPTLKATIVVADPNGNPLLATLKAAVFAEEAQKAWAHLIHHLDEALSAAGERATNAEGEPLWLHVPADGAWVATAVVPPEGAEGYRPLYVR